MDDEEKTRKKKHVKFKGQKIDRTLFACFCFFFSASVSLSFLPGALSTAILFRDVLGVFSRVVRVRASNNNEA